MKLRIVSDGTAFGTSVLDERGNVIRGITSIEISPINIESNLVTAKIEFEKIELDLVVTQKSDD